MLISHDLDLADSLVQPCTALFLAPRPLIRFTIALPTLHWLRYKLTD